MRRFFQTSLAVAEKPGLILFVSTAESLLCGILASGMVGRVTCREMKFERKTSGQVFLFIFIKGKYNVSIGGLPGIPRFCQLC